MSVKVAIRVRPFNQREIFLGCVCCVEMKETTTIVYEHRGKNKKSHDFTFDYSFWSHDGFITREDGMLVPDSPKYSGQPEICRIIGEEILSNSWQGYNCCLFAYGQTGAGKSYTMIGYGPNRGIIPSLSEELFKRIKKLQVKGRKEYEVTFSMLEIYNQKVQDLFTPTSKRPPNGLKIRENKALGVYVQGLIKYPVTNYLEIEAKMEIGSKNRSMAATLMNQYSSRAHTIISIEFIQKELLSMNKMNKISSQINLVDLAGSERLDKTGISDNKDRLKEASNINKSLHTLGRVIEALAEVLIGKKNMQIPYRQSALTRILEGALGGNSKTMMICNISPANDNYQETLATLRYADQTKKIKNKPIVNDNAVDKLIRQLREQNQRLKGVLRENNGEIDHTNVRASIREVQRQIRKNMQSFSIQDVEEEESLLDEFIEVPVPEEASKAPKIYITNLNEDEMLTRKVKYAIEDKLLITSKKGKEGEGNRVVLCGLGIQDNHAIIFKRNGQYFIEAGSETAAQYTLINGKPLAEKRSLAHNDRIILGTNSVFLFRNDTIGGVLKDEPDYRFAIDERQGEIQEHASVATKKEEELKSALAEIEKQFRELVTENDRKSKEKEEIYRQALLNMQKERETEKDMKEQLEQRLTLKSLEAEELKVRQIEGLKGKLKKYKATRESLLIGSQEDQEIGQFMEVQPKWPFKQLPHHVALQEDEQAKRRMSLNSAQSEENLINGVMEQFSPSKIRPLGIYSTVDHKINLKRIHTFTVCRTHSVSHMVNTKNCSADSTINNSTINSSTDANQLANHQDELFLYIQGEDVSLNSVIQKKKVMKMEKMASLQIVRPKCVSFGVNVGSTDKVDSGVQVSLNLAEEAMKEVLLQYQQEKKQEGKSQVKDDMIYSSEDQLSLSFSKIERNDISQELSLLNLDSLYKEDELNRKIQRLQDKIKELESNAEGNVERSIETNMEQPKKHFNNQASSAVTQAKQEVELKMTVSETIQPPRINALDQREAELQAKIVECNNENVLNQRTLQFHKRKREAEQLRKMLFKREKIEMQKQLIALIPMVRRFNLIARDMRRTVDVRVAVDYRNFSHFEMMEALKSYSMGQRGSLNVNVHILVTNYEEGRTYRWSVDTFKNRFEIIEQLYEKMSDGERPSKDPFKDPFWDPVDFAPLGNGYLSLECLLYNIQFDGYVTMILHSQVVAMLHVIVAPARGKQKGNEITSKKDLLQKDLYFTLSVEGVKFAESILSPPIVKYYVSYDILEEDYKTVKYCTQEMDFIPQDNPISKGVEANLRKIDYMRRHCFKSVTQVTLAYAADCPLKLTLHLIRENDMLNASMDVTEVQDSHSGSFFSSSGDFSNISADRGSSLKSSAVLSPSSSVPDFSKKSSIFYENIEFNQRIDTELKQKKDKRKPAVESEPLQKKSMKDPAKECIIY